MNPNDEINRPLPMPVFAGLTQRERPNLSLIPLDEYIPESIINKGLEVAKSAHRDQKRWGGQPYIMHPVAVAESLPRRVRVLGYLHDVMEDNPNDFPLAVMQRLFPPWITERLMLLTKLPGEPYDDYILSIMAASDWAVTMTKIKDLRHNLSDIKLGSLRDKYRLTLRALGEQP